MGLTPLQCEKADQCRSDPLFPCAREVHTHTLLLLLQGMGSRLDPPAIRPPKFPGIFRGCEKYACRSKVSVFSPDLHVQCYFGTPKFDLPMGIVVNNTHTHTHSLSLSLPLSHTHARRHAHALPRTHPRKRFKTHTDFTVNLHILRNKTRAQHLQGPVPALRPLAAKNEGIQRDHGGADALALQQNLGLSYYGPGNCMFKARRKNVPTQLFRCKCRGQAHKSVLQTCIQQARMPMDILQR